MAGDTYPKFRAAVVHAAPVFLDREATIDKVDHLAQKAKEQGADIVVFPESFVPAFPVWCILYAPIDQHDFYRRLFDQAVLIPGPAFSRLAAIAKSQKIFLSLGVTEKGDYSLGAMWNTNLLFDRSGTLINRHRKIMPTWAEKLIWAMGDGSQLRPARTEIGNIGTLICGENTNPLSRYALLAQGERLVCHLLYYTPQRRTTQIDIVEDVVPLFDVPLAVRADFVPRRVYLAPQGQDLPFERDGACIRCHVPEIRGHQMVVFE